VSFAAVTLCVASQRVFIVVPVYFVISSVPKLLDTPLYMHMNIVNSSSLLSVAPGRFLKSAGYFINFSGP
jgi:hypothetical protein